MPYLDGGAVDEAKALIRDNVKTLAVAVREGRTIVVPGPTCSYMLKQEYPWLDGSDDAKLVARNTRDLFEYLAELRAEGRLDTSFTRSVGAVTYHAPCHLRAQNIGLKSAEILRLIPGAEVNVVEKCSAVDGTWGFKKQYHELSLKLAQPLFDAITTADAPVTATDCELAATMLIEITASAEIKLVLDKLLGIDTRDYVKLTVGPHVVVGAFEGGHSDEERGKLSAVHFVRFALPPGARRLFREAEVALVVEHPNERARAVLSVETKRALLQDLPLQDPS